MRMLSMAVRSLRREWRSGELAVLWVSLAVAVAALTGVGFVVDRVGRAVQAQASEVLAADARVESPEALAPELAAARAIAAPANRAPDHHAVSGLQRRCQASSPNLRAASDGYPLRGALRDADAALCRG